MVGSGNGVDFERDEDDDDLNFDFDTEGASDSMVKKKTIEKGRPLDDRATVFEEDCGALIGRRSNWKRCSCRRPCLSDDDDNGVWW